MKKMNLVMAVTVVSLLVIPAVYAQSVIQELKGFGRGTIVAFDPSSDDFVKRASLENIAELAGVSEQSRRVDNTDTSNFEIVRSGTADVFVSNFNGEIKAGDRVTVSPIPGVGMRHSDQSRWLGKATQGLNDVKTEDISDYAARLGLVFDQPVRAGLITVTIDVSKQIEEDQKSQGLIAGFTDELASRNISVLRLIIAATVVVAAIALSVWLARSASRNAILSIGRNPHAEPQIKRSQTRTYLLVTVIILGALAAAFAILFA